MLQIFGTLNRVFEHDWYKRVFSGFRVCFFNNCSEKNQNKTHFEESTSEPPSFGTFPKIHPLWRRPSFLTEPYPTLEVIKSSVSWYLHLWWHEIQMNSIVYVQALLWSTTPKIVEPTLLAHIACNFRIGEINESKRSWSFSAYHNFVQHSHFLIFISHQKAETKSVNDNITQARFPR